MKKPVPASIESLFQRYPSLAGFSVRGLQDVPDHCSRTGDEDELFISDVGILPSLADDDSGEIFEDIAATLAELLAAHPEASELICGRTFARAVHCTSALPRFRSRNKSPQRPRGRCGGTDFSRLGVLV